MRTAPPDATVVSARPARRGGREVLEEMQNRMARWLGIEATGDYLLDPDDPRSRRGERLIVIVACCEAAVLLSACALGLWLYLRTA